MAGILSADSSAAELAGAIMNIRLNPGEDAPMKLVYGLYFRQDFRDQSTPEKEIAAAKHFIRTICDYNVAPRLPNDLRQGGSRYRNKTLRSKTRKSRR